MWVHIERLGLLGALTAVIAAALFAMLKKYPAKTRKARLSLGLHGAAALLCALAVCGFSVLGSSGEKAAFLLLDASASALPQRDEMMRMANEALKAAPSGQKTGVIAFGKDAMVEAPLSDKPALSSLESGVDADGSDLGAALSLAGALLPSDAAGTVAVITDGLIDQADAAALAARGIPVRILKAQGAAEADAQVSKVEAPSVVYQGQAFSVTVTVDSNREGEATLLLSSNRASQDARDVVLRKGENVFTFSGVAAEAGVATYEAQIVLPGDTVGANNRLGAYMAVQGAPHILIAEGRDSAGRELKKLLEAAGMNCTVISSGEIPKEAASLRAYHAIALCDVDADELSDNQLSALQDAVRTLGRGLAVFGGSQSYALGGYRGSSLEDMLPVTIDVKSTVNIPSLSLVLALDKSGSMTEGRYGVTRLEVAKEAAARAAEVLLPTDEIGVIAFDDSAQWVVRLQKAENLEAIQQQIGTIRPGGGTAFYSPLLAAYEALSESGAAKKHVIFLTDGEPGDQGFEPVIRAMAEGGITLTTVAVGTGANERLLSAMAEEGGGRAWSANEFDNVPKIFTKETMMLSGAYIQNRVFTPIVTEAGPLTDFAGFPQLTGYLGTTEKPLATVSLMSDREEPILAWWQYGAGRVICWTSDITGDWSESFLLWDQASAFFGNVLSQVLPAGRQAGKMEVDGDTLRYTAPEASPFGSAAATVLLPDGRQETLALSAVSPDTYEALLPDAGPGAYAVTVEYREGDHAPLTLEGGAVKSYSREYDLRFAAGDALERLTRQTGGSIVESPEELFQGAANQAVARRDMARPCMLLALCLFTLDVAQRRLPWEKWLHRAEKEERKEAKPKARPDRKKPAPKQSQGQTADELWQAMQKKKRM